MNKGGLVPSWTRHIARLITVRYWIALILIGLFVTTSYLVMRLAIDTAREGGTIMRMSAKQRVASQRICFLSHALTDATDPDERSYYRSTLRRAIRDTDKRNQILSLRAAPTRLPRGIRNVLRDTYSSGTMPFGAEVDRFLENARIILATPDSELRDDLPALLTINYTGSRQIMQTHKLIYELLKKESRAAVDRIQLLGAGLWILTLALLVVEVPFIFRPMVKRASKSLQIMELARRNAQRDAAAAEAAREGQASFIRTMSHELRTPLNAILGMSQLLRMGKLEKKQGGYVQDIQRAGRHLLDLINDVLEFGQLEAGQAGIDEQPLSLKEVVDDSISLLRPLAGQKNLELASHLDRKLADSYRADGPRIRQVLVNLIGNAIKFTQHGTVTVRVIYTGAAGAGGDMIRFEVEDTGIGVPPEFQKRIFNEFQQADTSLARKYGGTGLGLAISSRLVRLMDGQIGVESVAGEGSMFWFTLPLKRVCAQRTLAAERPAPPEHDQAGPPLRVLIAETGDGNRQALTEPLLRLGHRVEAASTGHDALLAVMKSPPDVVLMDLNLTEMDGLAAIRAIRDLPGPGSGVFIIAIRSPAANETAGHVVDAGADICMTRPVNTGLLREYLQQLTGEPERARSA